MGLGDVTGVFSRYFLVGFFLPSYVSLIALWVFASSDFVPELLESHSEATQLLILGGVALIAAMALSGLNYDITRAFEGYPLARASSWPVVRWVYRAALSRQLRSYDKFQRVRDDSKLPSSERSRAAWQLDQMFPHSRAAVLPTSMGNVIRAFEGHSKVRWGLDGVTIWPRVEALLGDTEREMHIDAKVDLYAFLNGAVGALIVGVCLVYDKAVNIGEPWWDWVLYAIPFAVAYGLYSLALKPAMRWGDAVRSSIDLHRLEVYEKLGLRAPRSFSDEREIADRLNKALLFGHPLLRDDLWRGDERSEQESDPSGTAVGRLWHTIMGGR